MLLFRVKIGTYPVSAVATTLTGIITQTPINVITYNILLIIRRNFINRVASYPIFSISTASGVCHTGPNQAKKPN
jgi:hypothetical protein